MGIEVMGGVSQGGEGRGKGKVERGKVKDRVGG